MKKAAPEMVRPIFTLRYALHVAVTVLLAAVVTLVTTRALTAATLRSRLGFRRLCHAEFAGVQEAEASLVDALVLVLEHHEHAGFCCVVVAAVRLLKEAARDLHGDGTTGLLVADDHLCHLGHEASHPRVVVVKIKRSEEHTSELQSH